MTSGYVQLRRGLQQHVIDGRMSLGEYGAYCWMLQSADDATGIWWGSAKAFSCQTRSDTRNSRYLLETLQKKGYIKRFSELRGKGNYAVLINRFICSRGPNKGRMVNAALTSDWTTPVYEQATKFCPDASPETASKLCPETAPLQEEELKPQEKEKKHMPAHPLSEIWKEEHGQLPAITSMSPERLSKCKARMNQAENPELFLADFRNAVRRANASSFLRGDSGGWKASFDWFVENGRNYRKVIEGNYDDRSSPKQQAPVAQVGASPTAEESGVRPRAEILEKYRVH